MATFGTGWRRMRQNGDVWDGAEADVAEWRRSGRGGDGCGRMATFGTGWRRMRQNGDVRDGVEADVAEWRRLGRGGGREGGFGAGDVVSIPQPGPGVGGWVILMRFHTPTPCIESCMHARSVAQGLDILTPLGRGMNLLVMGPRGSGKTTLAIDAVLAQANSGEFGYRSRKKFQRRPTAASVGAGQQRSVWVQVREAVLAQANSCECGRRPAAVSLSGRRSTARSAGAGQRLRVWAQAYKYRHQYSCSVSKPTAVGKTCSNLLL
eukprot:365741-Chlamydomonas_euryale.AAC.1